MILHRRPLKALLILSTCYFMVADFYAQNLVPNPSFENPTTCPTTFGQISLAAPWNTATSASPDYFNVCDPANFVSVPFNFGGNQYAKTGEGYSGIVFANTAPDTYREYIFAPLTQPLLAGVQYEVGFYVSLSDNYPCPTTEFGAYFSADPPTAAPGYQGILNLNPQFKPEPGYVGELEGWFLLQGCITAAGGEQYITIGNFSSVADTPVPPGCNQFPISYYFIEDVFVQEGSESTTIDFDLGDAVIVCNEYTIDPGLDDVNYFWSDGSQGSTLTVSESGTYVLTVTNSCMVGVDSVEVEIISAAEVELGPPTLDLCSTTPFLFSLNEDYDYVWQDGSTSPMYWVTETGLYAVTMNDGCDETTDEIFITIYDPLQPISLAGDEVLCPGEIINYEFDPSLGEFQWQDGTTSSTYAIDAPGTYWLTVTNFCGEVSASVSITALAEPEVDLGPESIELCAGQAYDISLPFDTDTHLFVWQDGSDESAVTLTEPGVYSVTVTNECGSGSDFIELLYEGAPVVVLPGDTILCDAASYQLQAGNDAAVDYLWQDGSSGSTYTVEESGTYAVTASNVCGSDMDQINIQFLDSLTAPDIGPDLILCQSQQHILYINSPGAMITWQDGSTQDSFIIQQAGTYFVTLSNTCNSASDTVLVQYNNLPPTVDLVDAGMLCQGDSLTLDANLTGVDFLWNDGSTTATLEIFSPGLYSVTISNLCGTDADSVNIVDGGPAPVVELGSNLSICIGDTVNVVPAFSNVDTWLWNNGESDASIEITSAGLTSVIATNSCGTSYDTLLTTLLPAVPPFSLGNDTAVCNGEFISLSITATDVSITWSDGSTDPALEVNAPGQYFATIANSCGEYADTIIVTHLADVPPLDLGNDQSLCPGELIIIDPGIDDVNYLWQDGSTDTTFSTTQAGIISLTISNACGTASDQLEVIENSEGPQVDLGDDITGCVGESITINSGIGGVDYLWQDGSTGPSFVANASGQVILNVSNNCGSDADTLLVDLSGVAPVVDLGTDAMLCDDEAIDLHIVASPGTAIVWHDGSTLPTYHIQTAGSYYVTLENTCGIVSDTIVVDYAFSPQPFSLGADTVLCEGESIVLYAPVTGDHIQWQDGSSASTYIADVAQLYSLQISNTCGSVNDEINLAFFSDQLNIDFEENILICPGDIIALDATQPFAAEYVWSTGATASQIDVATPGTYSVTVITDCGEASEEVIITASDACSPKTTFYIPNIFSPNGDGLNDLFEIQFNSTAIIESVSGQIYDRWGDLLYSSETIPFQWDGTSTNKHLNPGVFVYRFTIRYSNGVNVVTERLTGNVTMVR